MSRSVRNPTRAPRRKSGRIEARLTPAQKELLQRAADARGQTLTEFVVRASEEAAAKVLRESGLIVLDARDSRALADALLGPARPSARLRAAAARYRARQAT